MDATAPPASRNKRAKAAAGRSRRRPASARVRPIRRLAVIGGASAVFIAAFILDPDAVLRLFWACLTGHAGQPARVAAIVIALASACAIAFAFRPPSRSPPPKVRKKVPRRPVANATTTGQVETAGEGPASGTPGGKRGKRSVGDR